MNNSKQELLKCGRCCDIIPFFLDNPSTHRLTHPCCRYSTFVRDYIHESQHKKFFLGDEQPIFQEHPDLVIQKKGEEEYGVFARSDITKGKVLCVCKPLFQWKIDHNQTLSGNCYDWAESIAKDSNMMAHAYETMGGFWPRSPKSAWMNQFFQTLKNDVDVSLTLALEIIVLQERLLRNAHTTVLLGGVHSAFIYQQSNLFDHSCLPNATWMIDSVTFELSVTSIQDIPKGKEVTISYQNGLLDADTESRKQKILESFGFCCNCERCAEYQSPTYPNQQQNKEKKRRKKKKQPK